MRRMGKWISEGGDRGWVVASRPERCWGELAAGHREEMEVAAPKGDMERKKRSTRIMGLRGAHPCGWAGKTRTEASWRREHVAAWCGQRDDGIVEKGGVGE